MTNMVAAHKKHTKCAECKERKKGGREGGRGGGREKERKKSIEKKRRKTSPNSVVRKVSAGKKLLCFSLL